MSQPKISAVSLGRPSCLRPAAGGEGLSEVWFIQEREADAKQSLLLTVSCGAESLPSVWQQ